MNIDLDSSRSDLPPWDLTVTHGGRNYPVRQPTGDDLLLMVGLSKKNPFEAYPLLFKLFLHLTGIDESERQNVSIEAVGRFYTALGVYINDRAEKMKRNTTLTPPVSSRHASSPPLN